MWHIEWAEQRDESGRTRWGIDLDRRVFQPERPYQSKRYFYDGQFWGGEAECPIGAFDEWGVGVDGYDKRGFDPSYGLHRNGTPYDEDGYNQKGYNRWGYDRNGHHDGSLFESGSGMAGVDWDIMRDRDHLPEGAYDSRGFDQAGVHRDTGTLLGPDGLDAYGVDADGNVTGPGWGSGYNARTDNHSNWWARHNGFDAYGWHTRTGTPYDEDGRDHLGWDADGVHVLTGTRFAPNGYDRLGFDINGEHQVSGDVFDLHGFGPDGYNDDARAVDRRGFDRDGVYRGDRWISSSHDSIGTPYDPRGFDRDGLHRDTGTPCDPRGFDRDGLHRTTGTRFDLAGLDQRGYDDNLEWHPEVAQQVIAPDDAPDDTPDDEAAGDASKRKPRERGLEADQKVLHAQVRQASVTTASGTQTTRRSHIRRINPTPRKHTR